MADRKVGTVRLGLSRGVGQASVEDRRQVIRPRRPRARGQSLVELAIVLPVLLLILGGAVQYGVLFFARHELTQVARDTARWAATQRPLDGSGNPLPCESAASGTPPEPVTLADTNATTSGLISYSAGSWNSANFTAYARGTTIPAGPPNAEGVEVWWTGANCPPNDNSDDQLSYVTVRLTHRAPVFLPGLWLVTGGSCDGSGCWISINATSTFRMEPPPT
jgi:TadE-like protein